MRAFIFLLAALLLLTPALTQSCPPECNCAMGQTTCQTCKAGFKVKAAGISAGCELCEYRKGSTDANTVTTCAINCHESCSQCSGTMANQCFICRDGYRLMGVASGMGTCTWCPEGKGRARLMAMPAPVADEAEAICTATCDMAKGCGRCSTTDMCVNCRAGWRWNGQGLCAWCNMNMGKDADTMSYWGTTTAMTNAEACKTMCTGTNCGTCSMTAPGTCLACATGMMLQDGKCMASGSSATILQTLFAVIATAYAMF